MGWWRIRGTSTTVGDDPFQILGTAADAVVAAYRRELERFPTKAEWEALLSDMLSAPQPGHRFDGVTNPKAVQVLTGPPDAKDTVEWGRDPPHPILPDPRQYDITALRLEAFPRGIEPHLDLELRGPKEILTLRFWNPRDLEIARGGPSSLGFAIYDLSLRGLDELRVRVDNYEDGIGALRFVARSVEILERSPIRAG